MAKKKDDDVAAVYTSVMDHVVGEVHDDLIAQGVSDVRGVVLAEIRARWEAKLARRGAFPERDGAPLAAAAAVDRPVAEYGYCYNAPSSSLHHDAVVKEEEVAAVDDALFPAPAAPETNDGAASRPVVTRDLLGTLGAKRKRDV